MTSTMDVSPSFPTGPFGGGDGREYQDDTYAFATYCWRYLRFVTGPLVGQPLYFEKWQLDLTDRILRRGADGRRLYTVAYVGLAKKNNKSTWAAALSDFLLWWEGATDGGMQEYACAASAKQARIVFRDAKRFIDKGDPVMTQAFAVYADHILVPPTDARYEVLSSDAPKTHGVNPSVTIVDELHAHESGELYDAMLTATVARDQPLVIVITNAGPNEKSDHVWAQVYRRGKEGSDPRMFFWSPMVSDEDLEDPDRWKDANPASWITTEKLIAMSKQMPRFRFERFHLNRPTRAEKEWLPRGSWDDRRGDAELIPGERLILGVDMSKSHDMCALAPVAPREDRKYVCQGETWATWPDASEAPPDAHNRVEGDTIPFHLVFERVRWYCEHFDVVEIAYDPWRIPDAVSELLLDEGLPMVKFPQTPSMMCPASQGLFDAVTDGDLTHPGDAILDAHIAAAVAKETVGGRSAWRLDKDSAKSPSDYAFALAMALDRAREWEPKSDLDFTTRWI